MILFLCRERNHTSVTCVERGSHLTLIWELTWEPTPEKNLTYVHSQIAINDSLSLQIWRLMKERIPFLSRVDIYLVVKETKGWIAAVKKVESRLIFKALHFSARKEQEDTTAKFLSTLFRVFYKSFKSIASARGLIIITTTGLQFLSRTHKVESFPTEVRSKNPFTQKPTKNKMMRKTKMKRSSTMEKKTKTSLKKTSTDTTDSYN